MLWFWTLQQNSDVFRPQPVSAPRNLGVFPNVGTGGKEHKVKPVRKKYIFQPALGVITAEGRI